MFPARRSLALRLMLAALLSMAAAAVAGEAQAPEGDENGARAPAPIEEVVVIGSLIKRREAEEARAPVQFVDAALFRAAGAAQPVDVLKTVTANSGSYLATQQNYLQGTSQFSLRGLGLSSTLTLLNGRRAGLAPVSNDAGQGFFDINTVPVAMIDRIEILRDGASATYGSQAVAGVANIVTRRGFEGLEIAGGYRSASNSAYDLSFATGLASASGHFNLYGAWYEQDENFRTDFEWMIARVIDPNGDGDIVDGSFDSGRGSPGSFRRAVANADGTFSPFRAGGVTAPRVPDADCRAAGGYPAGALCRMDFSDQRTMIAAERRWQLFAEGEHQAASAVTLFAEASYSNNQVADRVGNMLLTNGNVEGTGEFFVPATHPFNFWTDPDGDGTLTYVPPDEWTPGRHQAVNLGYFGRPVGAEANGENAGHERRRFRNVRAVSGADVDLGRGWAGTFHAVYSRSDLALDSDRHWEAAEFAGALAGGLWNPFGTRLAAPNLVTPKTVAEDGLAPEVAGKRASNDPETFRQFARIRNETAETVLQTLEFVASGDLFEWNGQPVELAAGAQYRNLRYEQQPDPLNAAGRGPRAIREFPGQARQKALALFAESLAPLGSAAELQLALRHENYDQAGATTDPKVAARLFATEWLSVRGSWSSSFQAPTVFHAAGNTSTRTLSDPFRFDSSGNGQCSVNAAGEILDRGDNFNSVTVLRGGGLRPQSANLANLGILLQPFPGARLSFDLWNIHYRDVIAQGLGFQAILDQDCRDNGTPDDPRVKRDSSGQIDVIATDYENIAIVKTRGMDLNARFDLESALGSFRLSAAATLLTKFDVGTTDGSFSDQLGNRNDGNGFAPSPALRYNLGLSWAKGPHRAALTLRHIDSYKNDEAAALADIDSWTTLDFQYAYSWEKLPGGGQGTVFVGAVNLADRDPPPLPTGLEGSQRYNLRPGFDGFVHDIKGRTLYARFRYRV